MNNPQTNYKLNDSAVCMCSACGEFFKRVTYFDMHRVGGKCTHPSLIINQKTGNPKLEIKHLKRGTCWGTTEKFDFGVMRK